MEDLLTQRHCTRLKRPSNCVNRIIDTRDSRTLLIQAYVTQIMHDYPAKVYCLLWNSKCIISIYATWQERLINWELNWNEETEFAWNSKYSMEILWTLKCKHLFLWWQYQYFVYQSLISLWQKPVWTSCHILLVVLRDWNSCCQWMCVSFLRLLLNQSLLFLYVMSLTFSLHLMIIVFLLKTSSTVSLLSPSDSRSCFVSLQSFLVSWCFVMIVLSV